MIVRFPRRARPAAIAAAPGRLRFARVAPADPDGKLGHAPALTGLSAASNGIAAHIAELISVDACP
jgi:hypothetical protein